MIFSVKRVTFFLLLCSSMAFAQRPYGGFSIDANYGISGVKDPGLSDFSHFDFGLRYMFDDTWGIKLDYGQDKFRTQESPVEKGIDASRISVQAVTSLTNLIDSRSYFYSRTFNLLAHAGVGYSSAEIGNHSRRRERTKSDILSSGLIRSFPLQTILLLVWMPQELYTFPNTIGLTEITPTPAQNLKVRQMLPQRLFTILQLVFPIRLENRKKKVYNKKSPGKTGLFCFNILNITALLLFEHPEPFSGWR